MSNDQRHPFATGVIQQFTRQRRAHQRRALVRWLGRIAVFMAAVAALSLVAGLVVGVLNGGAQ